MGPQPDKDIFSTDTSDTIDTPRVQTTSPESERTPASRLLLKLYCESSPTSGRSPKKTDRVLVDKGVGTVKMRQHERRATTPDTPTKRPAKIAEEATLTSIPLSVPSSTQNRLKMSSSQTTYYDGDEEFAEIVAQMDDQEVEEMLPVSSPVSIKSNSASSGTSPRSTASTDPTSPESSSLENNERRRKRIDASVDEYPCRRAKPSSEPQESKNPRVRANKQQVLQSRDGPLTISAAHQRISKQDRPIPRPMRDPGHSSAVIDTSTIAVGASIIVHPSELPEKRATIPSPIKRAAAVSLAIAPDVNISSENQTRHVVTPSRSTSTKSGTPNGVQRFNASPVKQSRSALGCDIWEKTCIEQKSEVHPVIIAHDEKKQRLLDEHGIAKGVQFEIARGITHGWWTWEDITDGVVEKLHGTNFEKAGRVAELIGKGPKERLSKAVLATRQAIYAELDREQDAPMEEKGRGLGLMGPWKGKENWHGGCVQLLCKLEFSKDAGKENPSFVIRLRPFGIGKSNRAARKFTSLSILQLKFEEGALFEESNLRLVTDLLSKHVVICGRRYCAFCTKENKIFFVETRDDFQRRRPTKSTGDHYRISHRKFIKTTNPPDLNKGQAMNKWLARWQLMLSTSRPVIEFDPENIYLDVDDIYGETGNKDSIMTDGCGWMNLSALRLIASATNSSFPLVVHGRIAGAKGLWILHPAQEHRSETEPPKIWIRNSQLKIKLPPTATWDRSLRIFDLVRLPRLTTPSSLNFQTILNMSYNGVKSDVFSALMKAGLQKRIEPLTNWHGENACTLLAKAVEQAGGIMASRRSRGAGSEARLYSYVRDENDDDDESAANGGLVERDPISGCPQTLYESSRDMLVAGFSPLENAVLREKLRYILKQDIESYLDKFHIPIILSAEAFIAPDPFGILKEGEIYFRCSNPIGDPMICVDPHTFLGPVLVTRNPTRVPSDVRKVTAVSCDQLLSYTNVIIFSTKGKRSLASYLGGGDYDGDTVTIIAEPSLVEKFNNSDFIPEPPAVREAFEEEVERVSVFLDKLKDASADRHEMSLQFTKKVLYGLSDGKVGIYSNFHDNAIYELGYDNPVTIRLAYMFTTCLDAVKSGLRIKQEVFKEDSKRWNVPRPECMQTAEESTRNHNKVTIGRRLTRPGRLGPFVLETLKKFAKELGDKALHDFEKLDESSESSVHQSKPDDDLARPYLDMKESAIALRQKSGSTHLLEDIEKIESFVQELCERYIAEAGALFGDKGRKNGGSDSRSRSFSQLSYDFSRKFEEGPSDCILPPDLVRELKASYAHIYGTSKSKMGRGFAFAVAEDTVCALKIRRKGGASISRECRDYTLISSNLTKLISNDCIGANKGLQ